MIENVSIKISIDKTSLLIKFKNKLRDVIFGKHFGIIQRSIRAHCWQNITFEKIILDLTECTWADPTPMLSLIIEFAFQKDQLEISVNLPSEKKNNTKQFLKFLAQEGFLTQFRAHCHKVTVNGKSFKTEDIDHFKRLSVDLCYVNSSFIPAEIINANDKNQIIQWIESKLLYAESIAIDKAPIWAHDDLLYRLKVFLRETIVNVFLHAYPHHDDKYVGVYVRYREGLMGDLNVEQKISLTEAIIKESDKDFGCPRLPKEFLEERTGAIEIFVLDSGLGLCNSLLGNELKSDHRRRRLQKSWNDVFVKGRRKKNRKINLSKFGGLYLLGKLLVSNNDYLRACDDDEWCGSHFPMQRQHSAINKPAFGFDKIDNSVLGLCWTCRLAWLTPTDIIDKGFHHLTEYPSNYENILSQMPRLPIESLNKIYIDDRRFDFEYQFKRDQVGAIADCLLYMYYPPPNQTKNDILSAIQKIGSKSIGGKAKTLIICDIPNHEAITYFTALNDFKLTPKVGRWMLSFERLILVSRRLSGCIFLLEKKRFHFTFKYSQNTTFQLFRSILNTKITISPNLLTIYQILKYNDSFIFWSRIIKSHIKDRTYIAGDVAWGENKIIKDYLDFNQTLSDPICLKIYSIALARISGFFRDSKIFFKNIDYLTKGIVERYNSFEPLRQIGKIKNIYLGSVYVTGITEKKVAKPDVDNIIFHIFKHPSSKNLANSLLFWISDVFDEDKEDSSTQLSLFDWRLNFKNDVGYRRVGNSPIIAKNGHYYFTIPRWENNKCVYGRTPKNSYRDWQNAHPTIAKIGHWKYGINHDFVGINLYLELKNSFQTAGDLSKFLLNNFYYSLANINSDILTEFGKYILGEIGKRRLKKTNSKIGLIVYPSHPLSDLSIELIKKCLTENVHNRIISVRSIFENRFASALLLPPLALERIKYELDELKENGLSEILFYDTTCISGGTRKSFKHTLFSLGASEVKTLTLLDRRRLPGKVPNINRHSSYWRLDIPRLGKKNTCPICKALKILEDFKDNLVTKDRREKIKIWMNMWKERSTLINWKERGLSHSRVELEDEFKKFGIKYNSDENSFDQIGGDDEKIKIEKSIGLTLYVSEIHSMTGRSDLGLKYCKNEKKLHSSAIIELLSSQLLIFGNEFEDDTKLDILYKIFLASNSYDLSEETNLYTSLAAITIFGQEKSVMDLLVNHIDKCDVINKNHINEDMIIVLAYLLSQNPLKEKQKYERVKRLLTSGHKLSEIYNNLTLEIYSVTGLSHTKPLCKFSDESVDLNIRLNNTVDSLYQIKHLIEKIKPECARQIDAIDSYDEIKSNLLLSIKSLCKDIEGLQKYGFSSEAYIDSRKQINQLIAELTKYHAQFFFKLEINKINTGEGRPFENNVIAKIIDSLKQANWRGIANEKKIAFRWMDQPLIRNTLSGQIFPDSKSKEAWVVWDRKILEIIQDLFYNVIHSKKSIDDPWNNEEGKADMWIFIDYQRNFLSINMANYTAESNDQIKKKTHEKNRWTHLKEFNRSVEYKKNKNNILFAKIDLPYAGKIVNPQ